MTIARWCLLLVLTLIARAPAAVIWTEGEDAVRSTAVKHNWYSAVQADKLSGGQMVSHWNKPAAGEALYDVTAAKAGEYQLWLRANPTATKLSVRINDGQWALVDFGQSTERQNIAADSKIDLRFIAWVDAGKVTLKAGRNTVAVRFESDNENHGMLDCFVLADEPFKPRGILKPEQMAAAAAEEAKKNAGWFVFDPPADAYAADAGLDLRYLNEKLAGDGGFIAAKGDKFVHSKTGQPVRFWAVNKAGKATNYESAVPVGKLLAKRGVNLVRLHGAVFDRDGKLDPKKVQEIIGIVEGLKESGIYTHLSIYFPLWMTPTPGNPVLKGYDGKTHPFASLYFNEDFQKQYQSWWTALLTTPSPRTGKKLIDEPAVMGCEIINEDSFFFWTFNDKIPNPQLQMVEKQFGDWAAKKYGSLPKAMEAWRGLKSPRDDLVAGRLGFRNWWNVTREDQPRDKDAVRFLADTQKMFYEEQYDFLRATGFRATITASNWHTASPKLLGPIERYTYSGTDFIDRHGYFGSGIRGEHAGWSIRDGYTYVDRSAYRFDGNAPGKQNFTHPVFDITYADKPTMISETTHERPSRYRGEAPWMFAAYGSLQDTDAIVHFALDSSAWEVKPNFFMQQWTLNSPVMLGQFPAAAMVYRRSLITPGEAVVDLNLKTEDLLNLKGSPFYEGISLDAIREADVPGAAEGATEGMNPLAHLVGQVRIRFNDKGVNDVQKLTKFIDERNKHVDSANGQLRLHWGSGLLMLKAPQAQGVSGRLNALPMVDLPDAVIDCRMDLAHIVLVSLDDKPIASSGKILLQVMTEEKPTGFVTDRETGTRRIERIGRDPWLVRDIAGTVTLKRPDAGRLKLTPLDFNGYRKTARPVGAKIELDRDVVYYLIER